MNKIFLNRNRQSLGQFTPEEVAAGLKSGKFNPTDLAWREGMEAWQLLSSFDDLPPVEELQEIMPLPDEISPVIEEPMVPAWERRAEIGIFRALAQTVKQVMGNPAFTFANLKREGGIWSPLSFLLILGVPAFIFTALCTGLFQIAVMPLLSSNPIFTNNQKLILGGNTLKESMVMLAWQMVLSPVIYTVFAFIGSALVHSLLLIMGGAKESYETTFRVFCYTVGALSVLLFIPICGGSIQSIWVLVVLCIGLKEAHRIDTGRAVLTVLSLAMLCVLYVMLSLHSLMPQ
ncbi:MAG: YIP1 family protein [Chthoniobacterales bacterium]